MGQELRLDIVLERDSERSDVREDMATWRDELIFLSTRKCASLHNFWRLIDNAVLDVGRYRFWPYLSSKVATVIQREELAIRRQKLISKSKKTKGRQKRYIYIAFIDKAVIHAEHVKRLAVFKPC